MGDLKKPHFSYITWAVVVLGISALVSASVVAILTPSPEAIVVVTSIFGFVVAMTTAILKALRDIHVQFNSLQDKLFDMAWREGIAEGREKERNDKGEGES